MVYLILTHTQKIDTIFEKNILDKLISNNHALSLKARNSLLFSAIFFMIVAMARPVIENGEKKIELSGLKTLIALDISGSMRCIDTPPSRLEFAREKILNLLNSMSGDEASIIAFSSSSFMVSPFTNDILALKAMIKGVDDNYINMDSTNFTTLGDFSTKLLADEKEKILIVISDGGEKSELEAFKQIILDKKIKLYAIMIGGDKPANVIDENGGLVYEPDGKVAMSSRNDELGKIASLSGGAYIVATYGKEDMKKLLDEIKSSNNLAQKSEIFIKDRVELFYYPLSLALILLLLAFSSFPQRNKK